MYSQLSSGKKGLKFGLSLCLRFYFVFASNEGFEPLLVACSLGPVVDIVMPIFYYANILKIKISTVLEVSY